MTGLSDKTPVAGTNAGCALQYGDLRDWLAAVEAGGDLKVVAGANWHTDIGQDLLKGRLAVQRKTSAVGCNS